MKETRYEYCDCRKSNIKKAGNVGRTTITMLDINHILFLVIFYHTMYGLRDE